MRRFWVFALLALVSMISAAEHESPDTPRRVNGRMEDTILPGPTFKTEAERLKEIVRLQRRDADLIAKMKPPFMFCHRIADGLIKIDGKLDEPAWKTADVATDFKDTRPPHKAMSEPTRVMLMWDSKYLYVGFECVDTDVVATIDKRDGDFWKEDVAEIFVNPTADGMSYLEFEVSPRGLLYDGTVADYRPDTDWLSYKHLDIDKGRDHYQVRDTKVAAHVNGTLNNSDDEDKGWTCEMAISFADIARGTLVRSDVPQEGDDWRVGLYRINVKSHADPKLAEYGAWSPTTTWFHNPKLFGHVIFVGPRKTSAPR